MRLTLDRVGWTVGREVMIVSFRDPSGTAFNVRITAAGRMVSVTHGHRTLHSRDQRAAGGKPHRFASDKLKRCKELACAAVAAHALGHTLPPQEINL